MRIANALLLVTLLLAAVPAPGEDMDHSHDSHESGDAIQSYVLLDQLEVRDDNRETGMGWDMSGWVGTDLTRLWLRSKGEIVSGHTQAAELELLYGRSISPWWDLVAGVRHDFRPVESRTFAAIGVQGLAPQRIELTATVYIGPSARSAARLKAHYDLLLTNRLVLQPQVEADLYGKSDATRGLGSGLSTVEAGIRLRYEFTRQFAPYVGADWERAFGRTADLRQQQAGGVSGVRVVAGVRAWF